jgi:hypothetical protein
MAWSERVWKRKRGVLGPRREKEVTVSRRKLRNEHRHNIPILGSHGKDYKYYSLARCDPVWFGR